MIKISPFCILQNVICNSFFVVVCVLSLHFFYLLLLFDAEMSLQNKPIRNIQDEVVSMFCSETLKIIRRKEKFK